MERRRYGRVPFLSRVALTPIPGGTRSEARTLDLSLGGVGVLTSGAYAVGQAVELVFFSRDSKGAEVGERVLGRVANFKADVDGNRIGIEFAAPLRETECPVLTQRLLRS